MLHSKILAVFVALFANSAVRFAIVAENNTLKLPSGNESEPLKISHLDIEEELDQFQEKLSKRLENLGNNLTAKWFNAKNKQFNGYVQELEVAYGNRRKSFQDTIDQLMNETLTNVRKQVNSEVNQIYLDLSENYKAFFNGTDAVKLDNIVDKYSKNIEREVKDKLVNLENMFTGKKVIKDSTLENYAEDIKKSIGDKLTAINEKFTNESIVDTLRPVLDEYVRKIENFINDKLIGTNERFNSNELNNTLGRYMTKIEQLTGTNGKFNNNDLNNTLERYAKSIKELIDDKLLGIDGKLINDIKVALAKRDDERRRETERVVSSYFFDPEENCTSTCLWKRLDMEDSNKLCNNELLENNYTSASNIVRENDTAKEFNQIRVRINPDGSYYCESIEIKSNCSRAAEWNETICDRWANVFNEDDDEEVWSLTNRWLRTAVDLCILAALGVIVSVFSYGYFRNRDGPPEKSKQQQQPLLKNHNKRFTFAYQNHS